MRIAVTGGTGFVGRHLARALEADGHAVVRISRKTGGLADAESLAKAFAGCEAVAHLAGINLERGSQTYEAVHVQGTRNVVEAARRAGLKRIALLSFLKARPACGSPYHESKWAAEEIVRGSALEHLVLKAGVIYGRGDHMLDHLSHAFHTFPVFALVGMRERDVRPMAVEDVVRVLAAFLLEGRHANGTFALMGPEAMPLGEAVRRVAGVLGKRPLYLRLPVVFHTLLAIGLERVMRIPLVSRAQVRILSEGVAEALPGCPEIGGDLRPATAFTPDMIRRGLPEPKAFGLADCLA